jgi:hypothetical protein
MRKDVQDTIDAIYGKKNYQLFQEKCREEVNIDQGFFDILQLYGTYVEMGENMVGPGREWYVDFEMVSIDQFSITYSSSIKISRLIPVFIVWHNFSIDNIARNRIQTDLHGFSGTPYCKRQLHFHEKIRNYLQCQGYTELSFEESREQTCDIGWFNNTLDTPEPLYVEALLITNWYDWDRDTDTE